MKTLKFTKELIPLILSGEKTSTWRMFDNKDLQKDDELIFLDKDTREEFAKAVISSVAEKKLKDLNDLDFDGHNKYKDQDDMLNKFRGYYGDKVTLETSIKIIYFRLL